MIRSEIAADDRAIGLRLVEAADEARRQLERDLHDGAQQRLVLASLTLRRAAAEVRGTPAEPVVVEALDQLQQGLAELRELARGIHPAVLTGLGLAPALHALSEHTPIPLDVRVTNRRVQPIVEAAIYFTVTEALANVMKHADAASATVDVQIDEATVVAVVADDGAGGADASRGSGLRGLADRIAAVGGTLTVDSAHGHGTVLRATVPLGPHLPTRAEPSVR